MNTPTTPVAGVPASARGAVATWWHERTGRERTAVTAAAVLVLLAALWALVQPARQTLLSLPTQRAVLDAQWQAMQRQAAEARELRAAPPVSAEQAQAALRSATEPLGEKARLVVQGDRATLTVNGLSTSALRDWLLQARAAARARPIEARLTRAASGYNGSIVLAIGGGT